MNYIDDCFRTCYHFKVKVTLLPLPHQMTYHKAKVKSTIDESTILYLCDFFFPLIYFYSWGTAA